MAFAVPIFSEGFGISISKFLRQQIKKTTQESQNQSNTFNSEIKSYSEKTRVGEFIWQACYMGLIDLNKSKNKSNKEFIRQFYQFCNYLLTNLQNIATKMNVVIYITST